MNRSSRFVTVNAKLIMFLKSYEITTLETLRKWTTGLLTDELFAVVHASLVDILQPERFVGRCAEQVDAYLASYIDPLLARHAVTLAAKGSDQMRV